MFSFLKQVLSSLTKDSQNFTSEERGMSTASSEKEKIKRIFIENQDLIKEEDIAYWIVEKEVNLLKIIYISVLLVAESEVLDSFRELARQIVVNELFHINQNRDFTDIYNEMFHDCIKFPKAIIEAGQDKFVKDLLSNLTKNTKLLYKDLLKKKEKTEWEKIWKHLCKEYGLKEQSNPKDYRFANIYVEELIKNNWKKHGKNE